MAKRKAAAPAKTVDTDLPSEMKIGRAPKKAKAELVSFSVSAVIPTQQYGNIQPKIEVKAPTLEAALAAAMPAMEALYRTYTERPADFMGRITETVKVVPVAPEAPKTAPQEPAAPAAAPVAAEEPAPAPLASQKPEPVLKAEKAISLALSLDAIDLIGRQVAASVKIKDELKPALQVLVAAKKEELAKK